MQEIIEVGSGIKNLRLELAPLRDRVAQIECLLAQETHRLEALIHAERSAPQVAAHPQEDPPKRKKRPFASTGFIQKIRTFMEAHPNQQVTPESVASAMGEPNKGGLAATCLKRLYDAGLIHRPRTGHYVFRDSIASYLQPKQPKEPAMS